MRCTGTQQRTGDVIIPVLGLAGERVVVVLRTRPPHSAHRSNAHAYRARWDGVYLDFDFAASRAHPRSEDGLRLAWLQGRVFEHRRAVDVDWPFHRRCCRRLLGRCANAAAVSISRTALLQG